MVATLSLAGRKRGSPQNSKSAPLAGGTALVVFGFGLSYTMTQGFESSPMQTMRGAGMQAGFTLLLNARPGVPIGEAGTVHDAVLFVDEPSTEHLHPLFADQRGAVGDQRP
jgi:hypothetical protein